MKVSQIETPALILEKRVLEENMARMDALLADSPMRLYPHYKSHKCPRIAQLQLQRGAAGITCAKLSEAEDLADAGVPTIVIANQVVQPEKLGRLAVLAGKCRLTVCADSDENILALERAMAVSGGTLHVLVEYDVGMRRCGAETREEVLPLAKLIEAQPHLRFEGIQAYAGHLAHERNLELREREMRRIEEDVRNLKRFLEDNGMQVREVAGGSTGTVMQKPRDTAYTQLQAGSYLFMDCAYGALNLPFQNALFLLTTVISVRADRITVDGGVKSIGMDQGGPRAVGMEDARLLMSEEHATVSTDGSRWKLNDKIRLIPGHCCTTFNLMDKIYFVDGADVLDVWPVVSRGKSQ